MSSELAMSRSVFGTKTLLLIASLEISLTENTLRLFLGQSRSTPALLPSLTKDLYDEPKKFAQYISVGK